MKEKTNYGNWVPEKALYLLFRMAAVFLGITAVVGILGCVPVITVILGVVSAAKLDFSDETFDAAVSNFVFHEVRSAKDKREVVREALRVVKKGGAFSFQDMFSQKALYGDMDEFVKLLKAEGISEVCFIGDLEKKLDFVPGFVTTPWMIKGMGLLYGKK